MGDLPSREGPSKEMIDGFITVGQPFKILLRVTSIFTALCLSPSHRELSDSLAGESDLARGEIT